MSWGSGVRSTGGLRSRRRTESPLLSYVNLNEGLLIPWLQVRVLRGSLPGASSVCKVRERGMRVAGPLFGDHRGAALLLASVSPDDAFPRTL